MCKQDVSTYRSFLFLITMTHNMINMMTNTSTMNRTATTAMTAAVGPESSDTFPGPPDEGPRSKGEIIK